ncbi:acetyl-CoA C-acetyltransferase [Ferviditalea candida]|uniref:acetyl-CoA C-acetyltransferase n=1 Tax=Ferviditalea candida TaxID=3108399 RepID=A0ABU5ZHX9_9BACL|nr:acetyl-CoA C-acetyltransferase [Paenibacillaceae bacterium T2]
MKQTVIVGGARTAFGKFGGALREVQAVELGSIAIKGAMERAKVDAAQVDEVIMGMVLQGGNGQIPSRQAARGAGLDWGVPTETLNKVCASGLRSITLADQIIRSGDAETIIAGGMESMSNAPFASKNARWGIRMGDEKLVDLMIHDGLQCAFENVHMAVHANHTAARYEISRKSQDEWALRSQLRAVEAIQKGKFAEEIVPVTVRNKTGTFQIDTDEAPRFDTDFDKLSKLSPIFDKSGTVTAGNAPGVNDGAGAVVVMSKEKAQRDGYQPLAEILGHAAVGAQAADLAITPALAIQKLLRKTGLTLKDIDLFEVNEAFAAVALTTGKILGWDADKVNVNGGAVALGHPIGASGTRIVITLIYELIRRGGGLGIAAICSGAAQGDAVLVKV